MTIEEKIEIAETSYLESIAIIKRIIDINNGWQKFDKEYSNALWNYDAAVEGVLLYASATAEVLTDETKLFIKNNTVVGDFMSVFNSVGKRKLYQKWETVTWDNLLTVSLPEDRLSEIAREAISMSVLNFVDPLAKIDADITTQDFAADISDCVKRILHAVCSPDPDELTKDITDPDERYEAKLKIAEASLDGVKAGIDVFNDAFLAYWKGSEKID